MFFYHPVFSYNRAGVTGGTHRIECVSFHNHVCSSIRHHTSSPLVNEVSVSEIEMHIFVELIEGYKIHYLDFNLP